MSIFLFWFGYIKYYGRSSVNQTDKASDDSSTASSMSILTTSIPLWIIIASGICCVLMCVTIKSIHNCRKRGSQSDEAQNASMRVLRNNADNTHQIERDEVNENELQICEMDSNDEDEQQEGGETRTIEGDKGEAEEIQIDQCQQKTQYI